MLVWEHATGTATKTHKASFTPSRLAVSMAGSGYFTGRLDEVRVYEGVQSVQGLISVLAE
jgi:hypothetical protein